MSISLHLHLREVGPWLTPKSYADVKPVDPSDGRYIWLDSSLELENGLDVAELSVEVMSPVLPTSTEKG